MKGMFKRALAGVAAAALAVTGLALGAGAANAVEGDSSTITITGDVSGENRTFTAYQLATYAHPVAGEGGCASSVDLIQDTTWAEPTIADAAKTVMTSIPSEYAGNEVSYVADKANGQQLRDFADALADAVTKPQGTAGVLGDGGTVTIDVPSDGWYLVVDSLGAPLLASTKIQSGDTVYGCLAGEEIGSVVAKPSSIPTPVKKAYDADGNLVDSLSALVGSQVKFQVTSNVPNHTGYDTYDWQIVDTPSNGLVIDENTMQLSVNVEGVQDFANYSATVTSGVLTVKFNDVTKLPVGAEITITYYATVTKDAIVTDENSDGATNSVIAKHDDTESGTPGKVTVKSFGFEFTKVGSDETTPLDGAKFTVQKDNADGQYLTPLASPAEGWEFSDTEHKFVGENGVFSFQGLPAGDYYVAETDVPDNYMQNVKAQFTVHIDEDGDVTVDDTALGLVISGDGQTANEPVMVKNVQSITELPLTGAAGTMLFTVLGLLIAGAGALVYMKSRSVKHMLRG